MDERTAQTVRLAARTLGYNYDFQLLEAVEEVRDEIGLAVTALGRGDAEEGRYRLERAFYKFRMQVEPVFVHIHPSLTEAISRSLNLLSQATGIRTLDALTAYEAVEALRQASSKVQGRTSGLTSSSPCSRPQAFPGRSSSFWLGP